MKLFSKLGLPFFFMLFIFNIPYSAQSFVRNSFIEMPGDDYDFDLLGQTEDFGADGFITWINKNDSVYTVYLKQISPELNDSNIVISSDGKIKSNPQIAINRNSQGIKIVWEEYGNDQYRIIGRNYLNDSLSNYFVVQDSLTGDPQISLSIHRVAWIKDNHLYITELYPAVSEPVLVDSLNCASPAILEYDYTTSTEILYERIENGEHKIYRAEYNSYSDPQWKFDKIADGDNRNPDFGLNYAISFETIVDGIHKIKYSSFLNDNFIITNNQCCNYKNPSVFSYPIATTSPGDEKTPFFVAFDTDSIQGDNEVFIKTFYFESYDSLINVSDTVGNDFNPGVCYLVENDTVYVAIFWIHQTGNSQKDIWLAKSVYNPISTSVETEKNLANSFGLSQNFPNPFNPGTTIKYSIPEKINGQLIKVKLEVYDLLGRKIATLVNGKKSPGYYEVHFDASGLPSGLYFYRLTAGNFSTVKKMILMK